MASASAAMVGVVEAFLIALAATVASQLLDGTISTHRLFAGVRRNGRHYFSPERVQLLAVTVWVALDYLLSVAQHPTTLPDVSPQTLGLLGGSHAIYLGGKTLARLLPANDR